MSAISITTTAVYPGSNAKTEDGVAFETVTAGQAVYKDASTGKFGLADTNSATAGIRALYGVALNGATANQSVRIQRSGQITIGAALTIGKIYVLGSTPGAINPEADLASGWYTSILGIAVSTTNINIVINNGGVAHG